MPETPSHKRAKAAAAGQDGKREVALSHGHRLSTATPSKARLGNGPDNEEGKCGMSKTFAYAKLGPGNCFGRFFEKDDAFVFWWPGVTVDHWLGPRNSLQLAIINPRDVEEALSLWGAIHVGEFTGFTILPTKLFWFTIDRERVFTANDKMSKAWPKKYKEEEVLKGGELVYVKVTRRNLPLADVPNLVYSLPCDRRVAHATFYPIRREKYPQHADLLSSLMENQAPVVVTPKKRLLYLGPQQIETAVALALIEKGVKGISLRPYNLKTWDMIGMASGPLRPPFPKSGGIYIQIKRSLTDQQKREFEEFRSQLDNPACGFLICPGERTELQSNVLGVDWFTEFIGESIQAREYLEGCIGRWVGCLDGSF